MNMHDGYGSRLAREPVLGIDPALYASAEAWQAERRQVFAKTWQYAGDARRLARTGDHLAVSFAGYRVLVVRQADGSLKAFHNMCRHRAAPLVGDGCGRSAVLTCIYHGWAYGLDGGLRQSPEFGACDGFDKAAYGLLPVSVETWREHVFVNLDPEPEPLETALGALPSLLAERPLERCRHADSWSLEIDANWKVYVENYVEGYHVPGIHPAFDAELEKGSFVTRALPRTVKMTAGAKAGGLYEGLWLWGWPGHTFAVFPGGYDVSRISALGPKRTRVDYDVFIDPEAGLSAEQVRRVSDGIRKVVGEDLGVCAGVHENLASGVFPGGPLSPRHEEGIALFHDLLRRAGVA